MAKKSTHFKQQLGKFSNSLHTQKKRTIQPASKLANLNTWVPGIQIVLPSIIHAKDGSEMVLVNAGTYVKPHSFKTPTSDSFSSFYIDLHEITVKQYHQFHPDYNEKFFTGNKACTDCPAMGIDWGNANRYCKWAGKRLPTETEWETAARGPRNHIWPWGNRFLVGHANILGDADGFEGPAPVASFPPGSSIYGAMDMIGNVWEWVNDSVSLKNERSSSTVIHILKGGGWRSRKEKTSIGFQNLAPSGLQNPTFGFRCVKSFIVKN